MKECIYTSEKRDELIMLALIGELPSEAIASLLKHIESCEACRERFAQISQFDKELKSLAEPEPLSLWEIARITNSHSKTFSFRALCYSVRFCRMVENSPAH
jgi:predicted anti-sigma-YlaC factor YlaD